MGIFFCSTFFKINIIKNAFTNFKREQIIYALKIYLQVRMITTGLCMCIKRCKSGGKHMTTKLAKHAIKLVLL